MAAEEHVLSVEALIAKAKHTIVVDTDAQTIRDAKANANWTLVSCTRLPDPLKLKVLYTVAEKVHEQELKFSSDVDRENFYMATNSFKVSPGVRGRSVSRLSIWIGTFNMGDACGPDNWDPWIPRNAYDIYAIGVQECEYKPENGTHTEAHFFGSIKTHLGAGYLVVGELSLWSIRLIVLARAELEPRISNKQVSSEATGIAHVAGNKGGVGVGFSVDETSFLFVNSHLAAHQERCVDRNSNYGEIIKGMAGIVPKNTDISTAFDHCFWFGDLNYRIDRTRDETLQLITERNFNALFDQDQLRKEMAEGRVFCGFTTPQPLFQPTYRYDRGTRVYAEKKLRIPAWCDRILWCSRPHAQITSVAYNCCQEITTSDHSPVFGTFDVVVEKSYVPRSYAPPARRAEIRITNLRGTGLKAMDANGKSDPYILFHAHFIASDQKTPVIKSTLEPSWSDDQVAPIPVLISDLEYVSTQSLGLTVMDWDKMTQDDDMGAGFIPLSMACGRSPAPFVCKIRADGFYAGDVTGTIHCVLV